MSNIVTHLGKNLNWYAYRNGINTFTTTFTSDSDPFDISTRSFSCNIRKVGFSDNIVTLTEADGIVNNGSDGTLEVSLTDTVISNLLPKDNYFYEIIYEIDDETYPLFQGMLQIISEESPVSSNTSVNAVINLSGTNVNVAVTLAGGNSGGGSITSEAIIEALGYIPADEDDLAGKEDVANKATNFNTVNDTLYPSVKAVNDLVNSIGISLIAYVEENGHDDTAALGSQLKPFATITAALAALPSTGGVIRLGIGDFDAPADDTTEESDLKSNVSFEGARMPWIDSTYTVAYPAYPTFTAPTKLVNGTVIKGKMSFIGRNNIIIKNLGLDVGSEFCTAKGGIYASGNNCLGFSDANSGTGSAPTTIHKGLILENVIALARNATDPFHGVVIESALECVAKNIFTFFNGHGFVSKTRAGFFSNIFTHGHSLDGIILKSDVYAPNDKTMLSNFVIAPISGSSSNGLVVDSATADTYDVLIENGLIFGVSSGVRVTAANNYMERLSFFNIKALDNTSSGFSVTGNRIRSINFTNCVAKGNGSGFTISNGDGIVINNCKALNNASHGFSLGCNFASLENIQAEGNAGYGVTNTGVGLVLIGNRVLRSNTQGTINGTWYKSATDNNAPAGALYYDTFTRSDSSSDIGDLEVSPSATAWIQDVGQWGIASNKLYCSSARAASSFAVAVFDCLHGNGVIEVSITPSTVRCHSHILFRYADNNNTMVLTATRTGTGAISLTLYKIVAGSLTAIGSGAVANAWTGNAEHNIRVEYRGTNIWIYVDGNRTSVWNTNMGTTGLESNTKVGVRQYIDNTAGDSGTTTFDNFTFTP